MPGLNIRLASSFAMPAAATGSSIIRWGNDRENFHLMIGDVFYGVTQFSPKMYAVTFFENITSPVYGDLNLAFDDIDQFLARMLISAANVFNTRRRMSENDFKLCVSYAV